MDSLLSVLTVSIVACEEDKGNIATLLWFMKRPEYKKIMNERLFRRRLQTHSSVRGKGFAFAFQNIAWDEWVILPTSASTPDVVGSTCSTTLETQCGQQDHYRGLKMRNNAWAFLFCNTVRYWSQHFSLVGTILSAGLYWIRSCIISIHFNLILRSILLYHTYKRHKVTVGYTNPNVCKHWRYLFVEDKGTSQARMHCSHSIRQCQKIVLTSHL